MSGEVMYSAHIVQLWEGSQQRLSQFKQLSAASPKQDPSIYCTLAPTANGIKRELCPGTLLETVENACKVRPSCTGLSHSAKDDATDLEVCKGPLRTLATPALKEQKVSSQTQLCTCRTIAAFVRTTPVAAISSMKMVNSCKILSPQSLSKPPLAAWSTSHAAVAR
mmetsp:Transcript_27881/g.64784  ORF Transcript_27881/g.64784 Transcript_27881/m.64784 type:complete len:166 (-) Transcript_27881:819-1316(-)